MSRKYLILLSLSGFVVSFDQWLKHRALASLVEGVAGPWRTFLGIGFDFGLVRNTGFGFGLVSRAPAPFDKLFYVGVPAFALVLIVVIFIKLQDDEFLTSLALAAIFAGAVGNLIDRVQHGYVVDFLRLHIGGWVSPGLNLCDLSISAGLLLVFMMVLRRGGAQSVA